MRATMRNASTALQRGRGVSRPLAGALGTILPPIQATGRIRLDLRAGLTGDGTRDRWANVDAEVVDKMKTLAWAPAGVEVVMEVAAGQYWPPEGVAFIRHECGHLGPITVECSDAETIKSWLCALRGGAR